MNTSNLIKNKKYEYNSPSHGKWIEVVFQKVKDETIYEFNLNGSLDIVIHLTASSVNSYIQEIKS